jgi:hypothetical protein
MLKSVLPLGLVTFALLATSPSHAIERSLDVLDYAGAEGAFEVIGQIDGPNVGQSLFGVLDYKGLTFANPGEFSFLSIRYNYLDYDSWGNFHGDTETDLFDIGLTIVSEGRARFSAYIPFTEFNDCEATGEPGAVCGIEFLESSISFDMFGDADGSGREPSASIRAYVTDVPEPTSWALMISGFGLLGGMLRRQRAGFFAPETRQAH